jgi:hypothetical protein
MVLFELLTLLPPYHPLPPDLAVSQLKAGVLPPLPTLDFNAIGIFPIVFTLTFAKS